MPKTAEAALVVAQAYLFTTQPTPGDPRKGMHRAALQVLGLVGNRLLRREEAPRQNKSPHSIATTLGVRGEPKDPDPHMMKHHRIVATALGAVAEAKDPDLCMMMSHHDTTTVLDMGEEANDPGHPDMHMTMNTRKSRWGRHALPTGFAERNYPKDSNYRMINKSMTDSKSPSLGYQITFCL
jgi:hypothetical protein